MASTIKPAPISLVVCDSIYQEQPGGKTALVGLFNGISVSSFPAKHRRMAVYAALTGVREDSIAKLEIVHAESEEAVVSAEGPLPGKAGPLDIVDLHFVFNNVPFPEPGVYFLRFWGNGHLLLQRPFTVNAVKKPEKQ